MSGGGTSTGDTLPPSDNLISVNVSFSSGGTALTVDSASINGRAQTDKNATTVVSPPQINVTGVTVDVPLGETKLIDDNVGIKNPTTTDTLNSLVGESDICVDTTNNTVEVDPSEVHVAVEGKNSNATGPPTHSTDSSGVGAPTIGKPPKC